MVEFLLILTMYKGGIETVPHHFKSYELCEKAGKQIESDTDVQDFSCIAVEQKVR